MDLLKGTLDVLILKTLSWGPLHGYAVSKSIRTLTGDTFSVEEGALYPALRRLEKKGLVKAAWGRTATGRDAKFYTLTPQGVKQMDGEVASWSRYVEAMARVLGASGPAT
jgi:PadR family transcriptional regulator PadR